MNKMFVSFDRLILFLEKHPKAITGSIVTSYGEFNNAKNIWKD